MTNNIQPKVILLGIDGLDWDYIQLFCDHGHLPHFSRLFEQSSSGRMLPPVQNSAALVWSTMLSGVTEEWHGVLDDLEYGPGALSAQAVTQKQLRVPRVWDYADANGQVCHVLGWPATLPAMLEHGLMVSNGVQYLDAGVKDVWPLHPNSVYPLHWRETVLDYRILADDIPQPTVDDLMRFCTSNMKKKLEVPATLLLAQILSMHSLGIQMAEQKGWNLLALRFDTLPLVYGLPFQIEFEESPLNFIIGWYKLIDGMLAKYMSYLTDTDYLMVCSERGAPQGFLGKKNSVFTQQDPGVVMIKGPGVPLDSVLPEVGMLDICPSILAMLGFSAHKKMLGRSLINLTTPLSALIIPEGWPEFPADKETIKPPEYLPINYTKRLEEIGLPAVDLNPLIQVREQVYAQQLFALAYAQRQNGELEKTKFTLQQMVEIAPQHLPGVIMLARTLLELNDIDACEKLVSNYQYLKTGPIWPALIDGMVALGHKDYLKATQCFEELLSHENVPINVPLWYAEALLHLGKWNDAKAQLEKAVQQGTETIQAWQKLSVVEMQLGQLQDALHACNQAIALQPTNAHLLVQRFEIKVLMGDIETAKQDLLRALKFNPNSINQERVNQIMTIAGTKVVEIFNLKTLA